MVRRILGRTGAVATGDSVTFGTNDLDYVNQLLTGVTEGDAVTTTTPWTATNFTLDAELNSILNASSMPAFDVYVSGSNYKARDRTAGTTGTYASADLAMTAAYNVLASGSVLNTSGTNVNLWTGGKYGVIYVGPGTFTLNDGVVLQSNIVVQGSGALATLFKLANNHADNANATIFRSSTWDTRSTQAGTATTRQQGDIGITIRDLTIDGNKSNNATVTTVNPNPSDVAGVASWGHGIALYGSAHNIENVCVRQCRGAGIILQGTNIGFGDTTIHGVLNAGAINVRNFLINDNGQHGLLLRQTAVVDRGWTYKNGEPGIDIQTSGYFGGSNSFLHDLWCFYDSVNHGTQLGTTYDPSGPEIRVTGFNFMNQCFIEGPWGQADSLYLGYSGAPTSSSDFTLAATFPVLDASGIYMDGSRMSAIRMDPTASTCRIQAQITGALQQGLGLTYYNVAQGVLVLGSNNYLDLTIKLFDATANATTTGPALILGDGSHVASTNQIRLTSWDNSVPISWGNASNSYNNIIAQVYSGNSGDKPLTGSPNYGTNNILIQGIGVNTTTGRGYNRGFSTQNGGGTVFAVAHGLYVTPNYANVVPRSADALGPFFVTVGATNVVVTYGVATPSGTNNVSFWWEASI